ncbi:hypothetical protein TWF569_011945 [Orbilia oligospora]|uniref:VPS37 C-terminal domain-containing protein n=1 Tax=Orbilia oligospora TaxID=2813651 RepID=A0A7C8J3M1_ORBOL|nr:hypothetical protein TWF102_003297 [Orbilia oligospora]KAF3081007.1 hypothetical protein TWF706_002413 [Orbilia oligospora]KAF3112399.1 hypothetical protein TWF103_003183 [Orbilia oligospora]KAF3119861.1 hypothetical protein TWF703_003003 [Orbilia oligospora]KAF3123113.1 hypothetical protein TWF594_002524 [Orbilia oligospora]
MATSPPYQNIPPVPPYYDPTSSIPPPPPPKPNSNNASRSGTPYNPSQFAPPISPQQQLQQQQHQQHQQQQIGQVPLSLSQNTGAPAELFIPAVLQDKSRDDLLHILHSQHLLDALYLAHHPSSPQNLTSLTTSLSSNAAYAKRLQSLNAAVDHQRATTSSSLLKTRQLERSWREKENEMDVALNRFSARALHARLGQAVGEADAVSRALEESFLEDDGLGDADGEYIGGAGVGGGGGSGVKASKDVDNFVKSYRGVRALYHLRKERKERWDENRVGGWR